MRKNLFALGIAMLFPLFIFTLHARTLTHFGDTDRYYHFALSRMLSEQNAFHLETLPQADDLGWGSYFPDKEFLFHVATSIGYRIAGDSGVDTSVLLMASGAAMLLFWFGLGVLPLGEAFACAFAAFFTHSLIFRMLYLRPHVLAIFLFILLNIAIARGRPWLLAIASAGYMLAYHAFYVPFLCLGVAAALAFLENAKERKRLLLLCGAGILGSGVGLVVNPYFPSNVQMGLLTAEIPFLLRGVMKGASFGSELYPLSGPGLLKFYYFPYLVLLGAIALGIFKDFQTRFLLVVGLVFGGLSFQTVRAGEYLIPVVGLLLPLVIAAIPRRRGIAFGIAALQLVVLLFIARTEAGFIPDGAVADSIRAAVAAIPPGEAKVYNCEWDTAPFLLYARPDLRFVELLDPSLLFKASPGAYQVREDFAKGLITDPRGLVHELFKASYVLCRNPVVIEQLSEDAGFQRLFPKRGQASTVALFRVSAVPSSAFVHHLNYRILSPDETAHARDYRPGTEVMQKFDVADFSIAMGMRDLRAPGLNCARISADPVETERLKGARYLGLGGGGAIRAWRNGTLLFASGPEYLRARSVQALVRLEPPLAAKDKIDLLVCSGSASTFWTAVVRAKTDKPCFPPGLKVAPG